MWHANKPGWVVLDNYISYIISVKHRISVGRFFHVFLPLTGRLSFRKREHAIAHDGSMEVGYLPSFYHEYQANVM